ncbi:MAG: VWA domain-containing protein [Candidatus Promineifilaceae bacterium]
MSFAGFGFPLGFLALLGLPAVLAIHLFRERQRRTVVSSLSLWSFLELEVRGPKVRRIPLTWLLILDLLVALLLALALARPQVKLAQAQAPARQVVLALDVSASMQARDALPARFAQAQAQAAALLASLGPEDTAILVAFAGRPHWIGSTRELSLRELSARLADLRAGEVGHTGLLPAVSLAAAGLDTALPAELHIFTDAAFPEVALETFPFPIHWELVGGSTRNQGVIQLTDQPLAGGRRQLLAQVANFGDVSADRIATLFLDGRAVDSAPLQLPPNSSRTQVWSVEGGAAVAAASLAGADPYPQDDTATLGLLRFGRLRVALVAEEPEPLKRAIESVPGVSLAILRPGDYLLGMDFDVTFFRKALPAAWPSGVVVAFDPPENAPLFPAGAAQSLPAEPIRQVGPGVETVDFGGLRLPEAMTLPQLPPGFEELLRVGERPLLLRGQAGTGQLFVFLADPDAGNLARHPALPVLVAVLIQAAGRSAFPAALPAGQPPALPAGRDYLAAELSGPDGQRRNLLERPAEWRDTLTPGAYQLELVSAGAGAEQLPFGVNAGAAAESDIRSQSWPAGGAAAREETAEAWLLELAPWLLAAATLVLLLEAWLAWR